MDARTWLITGCSSGFGRVLAELLLERGERVVATARKPETLQRLIRPFGDSALALPLDVTVPESVEAAVATAQARFGAIDVLVNNAGHGQLGTVEDTGIDAARAMMETNFFGALAMIRAALPGMLARGSGHIVNIGSVAGQIGFPGLGYYSASKFALSGLSESLGAELAPAGLRVTLAELGPFETQFTAAMAVSAPSPRYDLAALSQEAGNAHWGRGEDPYAGAYALLRALDDARPPRRIVIGKAGVDVVELHDARRQAEREQWRATSRLRPGVQGSPAPAPAPIIASLMRRSESRPDLIATEAAH